VPGNGTGCTECHGDLTVDPGSHINGTWQADQATNTESRFLTRSTWRTPTPG